MSDQLLRKAPSVLGRSDHDTSDARSSSSSSSAKVVGAVNEKLSNFLTRFAVLPKADQLLLIRRAKDSLAAAQGRTGNTAAAASAGVVVNGDRVADSCSPHLFEVTEADSDGDSADDEEQERLVSSTHYQQPTVSSRERFFSGDEKDFIHEAFGSISPSSSLRKLPNDVSEPDFRGRKKVEHVESVMRENDRRRRQRQQQQQQQSGRKERPVSRAEQAVDQHVQRSRPRRPVTSLGFYQEQAHERLFGSNSPPHQPLAASQLRRSHLSYSTSTASPPPPPAAVASSVPHYARALSPVQSSPPPPAVPTSYHKTYDKIEESDDPVVAAISMALQHDVPFTCQCFRSVQNTIVVRVFEIEPRFHRHRFDTYMHYFSHSELIQLCKLEPHPKHWNRKNENGFIVYMFRTAHAAAPPSSSTSV